jgi:hypothetical protein
MEAVISELGLQWKVGIRNGDTSISDRQKQKRLMPEIFIITPESLHLLLAQKGYPEVFKTLRIVAVDEWHELIGGKRGCAGGVGHKQDYRVKEVTVNSGKCAVNKTTIAKQRAGKTKDQPIYNCGRSTITLLVTGCQLLHLGYKRNHWKPYPGYGSAPRPALHGERGHR